MSDPKTITEALAALKASQERITALEADLASANELLTEAQNAAEKMDLVRQDNAALLEEKMSLEVKVQQLTEAARATEAKVTDAMASLGVPPVAIAHEGASAKSRDELWSEYRALPVDARNDFYRANRGTMKSH